MSKFIAFKNGDEFCISYDLSEYKISRRKDPNFFFLYIHNRGIWIRDKKHNSYVMVVEFRSDGLVLRSDTKVTTWKELLEGYTFLSGHPCGKWENKND